MGNRGEFMLATNDFQEEIYIEGQGRIFVDHLFDVHENTRDQAFELKMRMTTYWKIVLK